MASLLGKKPVSSANVELIKLLGTCFVTTRDGFSVETETGWTFVDRPMQMADFVAHLDGTRTMGLWGPNVGDPPHEPLRYFCIDVNLTQTGWTIPLWSPDEVEALGLPPGVDPVASLGVIRCNPAEVYSNRADGWRFLSLQLLLTAEVMTNVATDAYPECRTATCFTGGRGFHFFVFHPAPLPAAEIEAHAREFMKQPKFALAELNPDSGILPSIWVPLSPDADQNRVFRIIDDTTPMRLPLGRHAQSGRRSTFVDPCAPRSTTESWEPVSVLPTAILGTLTPP